jgi:hypothetical protein
MKTLMFVVWFGGFAADTSSTHFALNQGAHESVLSQKPWVNHVIIGGQAAGGAYGLQRFSKNHPKLAVTLGIAAGALRAGIAARNFSVARQMRQR